MLKVVEAEMCLSARYEYDPEDPMYAGQSEEDIIKFFKYVFLTDVIETPADTEHFDLMKISVRD